jgi:hypothetical protein
LNFFPDAMSQQLPSRLDNQRTLAVHLAKSQPQQLNPPEETVSFAPLFRGQAEVMCIGERNQRVAGRYTFCWCWHRNRPYAIWQRP